MRERRLTRAALAFGTAVLAASPLLSFGQAAHSAATLPAVPSPLDPTRDLKSPVLQSSIHKPLPEQYIWTARDTPLDDKLVYRLPGVGEQTEKHLFRTGFTISRKPEAATIYLAGPRSATVWLNGQLVGHIESDLTSPLGMHVFALDVSRLLRIGNNTLALEAVRGRGVSGYANSALVRQQTFGQVLVAKIVPAARGVDAPALLLSGPQWKSTIEASGEWWQPSFDDAGWKPVQSLGGIESSIELFQWNADAGLYDWPGYDGISPFLARTPLPAHQLLAHFAGRGKLEGLDSLTGAPGSLTVTLPTGPITDAEAPSVFLDFGRELTGRVEIVSDSDAPVTVSVQMGESEIEAGKDPYLGVNDLVIPPHGTGHGSKTAFRYAKVRFLAGPPQTRIKAIRADHIFYPVTYAGSFESSDPLLNRIWETGAYTTHLCMQDDLWDAPKRDRGRWMGDTDVSGRVVEDVFGDRPLMEDTLDRLMGPAPVEQQVNGIPGYSAFWFSGVADYYRHTGAKDFLVHQHDRMLQLLHLVDAEFDQRNIYSNKSNVWLYVDWSPDLNGDTPETRRATTLEFYRAYREAAWLLTRLGDTGNADRYTRRAAELKHAAETFLVDPGTGTFGLRWQSNAAAVVGGAAGPERYDAIWKHVFSGVNQPTGSPLEQPIISPYYNYYVIRAMAEVGHRPEALGWIRTFWGGMIEQGATSFWEGYDPRWYKSDFHASLQADNRSGYFVSLAHGWSAGPTAWLMEQVLGIQPTGPGFSTVDIRPDLVDLAWAKGAEPTPHGLLSVNLKREGSSTAVAVDLPAGVVARVSVPVTGPQAGVFADGKPLPSEPAEGGTRRIVTLSQPARYTLTSR